MSCHFHVFRMFMFSYVCVFRLDVRLAYVLVVDDALREGADVEGHAGDLFNIYIYIYMYIYIERER